MQAPVVILFAAQAAVRDLEKSGAIVESAELFPTQFQLVGACGGARLVALVTITEDDDGGGWTAEAKVQVGSSLRTRKSRQDFSVDAAGTAAVEALKAHERRR